MFGIISCGCMLNWRELFLFDFFIWFVHYQFFYFRIWSVVCLFFVHLDRQKVPQLFADCPASNCFLNLAGIQAALFPT